MKKKRRIQKKAAMHDRAHDLYETPACATEALLRHVRLPWSIWEPAAGRGAIARVLRAAGHNVVSSDLVAYPGADADIATSVDFLRVRMRPIGVAVEAIVTNPPYGDGLRDAFIRHGLRLGLPVVALLPLGTLAGDGRSDLIDDHLAEVLIGRERLPMMHRDGWQGPRASSAIAFAWFVWDRSHGGPPTLGWL